MIKVPMRILLPIVMLLCMVSSGCQSHKRAAEPPKWPRKVAGASDASIETLEQQLEKSGVRMISMGQDFLISIPAPLLFPEQSPRLTWASYGMLNDIACYLKQFRFVSLYVTGYSSPYMTAKRQNALTRTRARAVMDYLASQGVDGRLMVARGLGNEKPITVTNKGGDKSPNARIEITFRRTIV